MCRAELAVATLSRVLNYYFLDPIEVRAASRRPVSVTKGKYLKKLADPTRFERATFAFGGRRSIQLSYGSVSALIPQTSVP